MWWLVVLVRGNAESGCGICDLIITRITAWCWSLCEVWLRHVVETRQEFSVFSAISSIPSRLKCTLLHCVCLHCNLAICKEPQLCFGLPNFELLLVYAIFLLKIEAQRSAKGWLPPYAHLVWYYWNWSSFLFGTLTSDVIVHWTVNTDGQDMTYRWLKKYVGKTQVSISVIAMADGLIATYQTLVVAISAHCQTR